MNEKVFSQECVFVCGATDPQQFVKGCLPEIAFAGRSNVGKSSLLNALTSAGTARVSKTPGRTQQINFFRLANKLVLVDLPGYGYAAVSKKTRSLWDDLIMHYLLERENLRRVFLLVDARHTLMKYDAMVMDLFEEHAIVYQIVLTKADKQKQIAERVDEFRNLIDKRASAFPELIVTSSISRSGIELLQRSIVRAIEA